MAEKRKTTTSYAVLHRYKQKTYSTFRADIRKEDFNEIEEWRISHGMSRTEFVKVAYEQLSAADKPPTE